MRFARYVGVCSAVLAVVAASMLFVVVSCDVSPQPEPPIFGSADGEGAVANANTPSSQLLRPDLITVEDGRDDTKLRDGGVDAGAAAGTLTIIGRAGAASAGCQVTATNLRSPSITATVDVQADGSFRIDNLSVAFGDVVRLELRCGDKPSGSIDL